jgi:radical SAM superfamily enzyme YgiQ (UPF0313 family)
VRAVNPRAHLCFFGLYAGLNAAYLFARGADSVISGEVEAPLVDLARAIETGDAGPLPSSVRRSDHAAGPHLARLDFPAPSRAALPSLKRYAQLEHEGRRELVAYVEASRGCLHLCRHCPIPPVYGGRFFAVPREVVLADVRQQLEAGARHVTFGDPDFLNGPSHAWRLLRELHAQFPSITFDFTAKVEHLLAHRARLAELASLGCLFIVTAAESLNDTVLEHLRKGHTRRDITAVMEVARAAGIDLRPTWVAFTPWTTLADYRELLDFIEAQELIDHVDPVQYSLRLLVPPGSLLLESPDMAPHLGALEEETLSYRWTHPDPRMDRLQEDVRDLVGQAASRDEDAMVTFDRVRALADLAAGERARPSVAARSAPGRSRPPRLTEPWFC